MKSKLIKIYQYRKGGQLFINATGIDDNGDFYLKSPPRRYGRVLPRSATDEEIGRTTQLLDRDLREGPMEITRIAFIVEFV